MENQSAKKRGGDDDDDGSVISIDRLSELPQPILHHILCLLSQKEAIQTCVLSKSWRYLWCGRPKLEFPERCVDSWKFGRGELINVVDKTLNRYHDQNLSIEEFILEVPGSQSDGICSYLEKWISILISLGGVKTFNLKLVQVCRILPQVVFLIESLQELNLYNCRFNKISSPQKVMLNNLQTLRLRYVSLEEETFGNIMSNCPLIQCLVIYKCRGLRTIKVSNAHNLKNFDCDSNFVIPPEYPKKFHPIIEINDPATLQSIRIGDSHWDSPEDSHTWYCHPNNNFFPNLKSVNMYRVRLPTESFDIFSSHNSPCLEVLELSQCDGFKEIKLSSSSIKRLVLMNLFNSSSIIAAIDTPNILYFKLEFGDDVPSEFSFTKTSSCEWKSDISTSCGSATSTWLLKLNVLLKTLSQSQIFLNIYFPYMMNQRFEDTYEGFNEHVVVKNLRLRGSFPPSFFPDFINYLFRNICRPRYIIDSQIFWENIEGNGIGRESLCKVLVQEKEKMDCLWQQDLEEISTEELKDADDVDAEELRLFRFLGARFRLRLKWKG